MLISILGLLPVSCHPVAQKTNEQANIVADSAVTGANEVAQATVEGVENAAVASGFVSAVSDVMSHDPSHVYLDHKIMVIIFTCFISFDFSVVFLILI